ncbi:MAG: thiamine phosphate synthase, partial [Deltaproteobacteria bacterium]|nr:thiamine phosphate synthase [Deltaproteobacteria bacterium]
MPKVDFSLCLITARNVLPAGKSLLEVLRAALEGGLRCVQLREKDLSA